MRGSDAVTGSLFSYVDLEDRVPAKHPLRVIREVVNEVLVALDAEFSAMYADLGRASIPPERLLRGSLIQRLLQSLSTGTTVPMVSMAASRIAPRSRVALSRSVP